MITEEDFVLFKSLVEIADRSFDGHLTVMKFTTNWRVGFGTPDNRDAINGMAVGKTFADAAQKALGSR